MKLKSVQMCLLFDFYGDILTDKQRELFDLYYNEDMSLAEISENVGITRQGVRDAIVHSERTLTDMESKLGLVARYGELIPLLNSISDSVNSIRAINDSKYINPSIEQVCLKILNDISAVSHTETGNYNNADIDQQNLF